jgi:hypothetical protein
MNLPLRFSYQVLLTEADKRRLMQRVDRGQLEATLMALVDEETCTIVQEAVQVCEHIGKKRWKKRGNNKRHLIIGFFYN